MRTPLLWFSALTPGCGAATFSSEIALFSQARDEPANPRSPAAAAQPYLGHATRGSTVALLSPGRLGNALMILSPLLAILSILMLLGILLWLLEKDEQQSQREELIRDALWVEQTLQLQFRAQRDRLVRLAQDIGGGKLDRTTFITQAQQLRLINRELSDLAWLDAAHAPDATVPMRVEGDASVDADFRAAALPVLRSGLDQSRFTAPYRRANGQAVIAFVAPIVAGEAHAGEALIAVFSLDTMLAEHVPWWIAERRAVHISDGTGNRLASRSRITPDAASATYTVQIGPPLINIALEVVNYRARTGLAQNGLVGAMLALGLFASAGLIARERHLRRRREAEAALDDEHAFRRALEGSAMVGMRGRDMQGRLLYVNPAFCRMLDYDAEELVGLTPPMPYWAPEDLERTRRLHDAVLASQSPTQGLEFTFLRRDGTRFEVLIYEEPWLDAAGTQRGWIGSVLDISDRKRAEEREREQTARLQQTARLVTMGEMASLLAHDLNQPLAAIQSFQTGLVNRLAGAGLTREEIIPALNAIGQSADRAGRIVRRVQDFVRRAEPRLEPLDIGTVIAESVTLLEPETRRAHISVDVALEPDLPLVRADRVLITQVLVNLLRNSAEALAGQPLERRRIRIDATRQVPDRQPHRRDQNASDQPAADGGRIDIGVRDWGPGVAPAIAASLFQPFVSSKSSGLGLGLTICRSIVEVHGSHIRYSVPDDGGASFRFALSQAPGDAARTTPSEAQP